MGGETRRITAGGRHKKSTPPVLSHEFIIQNHGDIMSCVLMVLIVGLMFPVGFEYTERRLNPLTLNESNEVTASMCSIFVAPQYNKTVNSTSEQGLVSLTLYQNGPADVFIVMFYTVAWVVVHAVIQEYILDKLQRKARLSKMKTFKFTESGHMALFALYSSCHAAYVIMDFIHSYTDIKRIWLGYPEEHRWMNLNMKMFAVLQISYWFHQFPEFYFQKMKTDEIRQRTILSVLYITFIAAAYIMNFMRFAVVLLALEYISQTIFHFSRLLHFLEKKDMAKNGFNIWNLVFLIVRLASSVLTVMTFWYGLRQSESAYIDIEAGNYNTTYVRLNCLLVVLFLQLFQLWNFTSFHVGRFKENAGRKTKSDSKRFLPQQKESEPVDESESTLKKGKKKAS
ncbi:Longevity-assurance protein [Dictyocaulus viviparus]|uniref:Longevity-assurance protein n=1 Tax=Dictyocaulus viviparus TaxID=29172 RepID=A0A0D8Y8F4_DICVI|nr:Longevity-assurance protein [Dictyocaulus viviparus]